MLSSPEPYCRHDHRTFSLPHDAVALEQAFRDLPELEVEAERIAAHSRQWVMPCLWAANAEFEAADAVLAADPSVEGIVLLVVDEEILTDALFDRLHAAVDRGVDVLLGGETDAVVSKLDTELSSVSVFEAELDWLMGPASDSEVAISRLLLVDRETVLVSSFYPQDGVDGSNEQAIFASGLENGVVVLIRRLIASGFYPRDELGHAAR